MTKFQQWLNVQSKTQNVVIRKNMEQGRNQANLLTRSRYNLHQQTRMDRIAVQIWPQSELIHEIRDSMTAQTRGADQVHWSNRMVK